MGAVQLISPASDRKGLGLRWPVHEPANAFDADRVSGHRVGLAGELGIGEIELRTGKLDASGGLCVASRQRLAAVDVGNATW